MLGVGLSAVPAAAHTPAWTVDCSSVTVTLKNYDNKAGNTVTVTDVTDGSKKLLDASFPAEFQKSFDLDSHSQEIKLHLSVKSADGQGAIEEDKTAPVCPGQESSSPAPSESTPAPETSSPAVESPAPSESSTSPAAVLPSSQPSPAGDDLAETGSSSSTPMIAGGAAVVLIAGAGILWASRKRRATSA
ncbi:hypothetical protein HY68_32060 [Streptomyces sp. AcH 505]|nr:hypothetical protein HY68_32060 [Streptomyces sp. AcH 505]